MKDDFQVQQQLLSELDSGEKIIWQGQPKRRLAFQNVFPNLFVVIWFGLITSGIFFGGRNGSAHNRPPPPFFMIFPFLILISVIAVPLKRFFSLSRTYYLLTNRRALIITLGATRKVSSYYPDKLQTLERRERKDGWGDLIIDKSMQAGYRGMNTMQGIGFMNIPEVKRVETLVRSLAVSSEK